MSMEGQDGRVAQAGDVGIGRGCQWLVGKARGWLAAETGRGLVGMSTSERTGRQRRQRHW